ncbi:hypothetical protein SUDANB9_00014 [Streptomyces sp. enrichment culture]
MTCMRVEDVQAACTSGRSTRWPRSKRAPAWTRATRWGAFTARHHCWADSTSLKTMASAAAALPPPPRRLARARPHRRTRNPRALPGPRRARLPAGRPGTIRPAGPNALPRELSAPTTGERTNVVGRPGYGHPPLLPHWSGCHVSISRRSALSRVTAGDVASVALAPEHLVQCIQRGLWSSQYHRELMDGCLAETGLTIRPTRSTQSHRKFNLRSGRSGCRVHGQFRTRMNCSARALVSMSFAS